jgi:hypothetical protein
MQSLSVTELACIELFAEAEDRASTAPVVRGVVETDPSILLELSSSQARDGRRQLPLPPFAVTSRAPFDSA